MASSRYGSPPRERAGQGSGGRAVRCGEWCAAGAMAKPEERTGGSGCVGLVTLGVAVAVALAGLAFCVMCLDARRQEQLSQLTDQVDSLRQLISDMQNQLASFNTTVQARKVVKPEATEEVVYDNEGEGEYEYDAEDDTSYYDDNEDDKKGTVKRTAILSQDVKNKTGRERLRRRRAVPVLEERYVPSTKNLWDVINSRNKSEGLRIYATYFNSPRSRVGPLAKVHQSKYSESATEKSLSQHSPGPHLSQHPEYQEQKRGQESVVRFRHGGVRHLSDIELMAGSSAEEFVPNPVLGDKPCQILAAHFVGDTSSYNTRDHPHYKGNSILHHSIFKDWVPANWMFDSQLNKHFPLVDGKVIIQRPGIYFVYAQVYYTGSHDRCGFHIKRNGTEVAQCMTTTVGRHMEKRNTCFTALVLHLQQSDALSITEVEGNRNTSFKNFHSFFGLVQLKPT